MPGHDSRLGQVVSNLIDNARSFSPPGGTVRVTCRRLKNEIEIVVDDDGPGIRPEALDKIFERFYTDRPHQGFGQNSGLGLSISKQIVEAHGGSIRVENRTSVAAPARSRACSAPASWCGCRRCDGGRGFNDPRLRRTGRAQGGADPRAGGLRQIATGLGSAAGRGARRPALRAAGGGRPRHVEHHAGRLLVRPAPALAGMIEIRGLGIRRLAYEPVAAVGLVVDLAAEDATRHLGREASKTIIAGVSLPRLAVAAGMPALPWCWLSYRGPLPAIDLGAAPGLRPAPSVRFGKINHNGPRIAAFQTDLSEPLWPTFPQCNRAPI